MGLDCNSNKNSNNEQQQSCRIESNIIFERNSLIIAQNFCVNAAVGGEPELIVEQNLIPDSELQLAEESSSYYEETDRSQGQSKPRDYTLIYAAPALPMSAPLLMTIIAKNLSDNDVLVSMEDDEEVLVEEIVPAQSELALTAQNALFIRALALSRSQVEFFICVYHPANLYR